MSRRCLLQRRSRQAQLPTCKIEYRKKQSTSAAGKRQWQRCFLSPCGDELQCVCLIIAKLARHCFRPFAGINCNIKPKQAKDSETQVSVPLRGTHWISRSMGRLPMVSVPLRSINLLYHTLSQKKRTIHRRSADGVEMISHKDHLDSAEGASKPSMGRPRKYSSMRSQSCSLEKPLVNSQLISRTASV